MSPRLGRTRTTTRRWLTSRAHSWNHGGRHGERNDAKMCLQVKMGEAGLVRARGRHLSREFMEGRQCVTGFFAETLRDPRADDRREFDRREGDRHLEAHGAVDQGRHVKDFIEALWLEGPADGHAGTVDQIRRGTQRFAFFLVLRV